MKYWGIHPTWSQRFRTELAVLASIETRYSDELARLEDLALSRRPRSTFGSSLRSDATLRGSSHVLRLADLHQQMLQSSLVA